jgi:ParB family chromosome partitioning protein
MNTEFKLILLKDIKPDQNQPRKYYDEASMQELTDSVREKGILQPILIRIKNGKPGYILVCGERRYKAALAVNALFKERDSIPAVIRDLSDEEALELQIIENLQRKDVHPLEEAVAFKSLIEKGKDLKEVAARIGKSEYYAKQRLRLNDLTKEWQTVYYAGRLSNSDALRVCVFDPKIQKELYDDVANGSGAIGFNAYTINRYRGDLSQASFDINDPSLDKKMGACTTCRFNSACASLFPDSSQAPKCTNVSCFKNKSDAHFNSELDNALLDPTILFAHAEHSSTYSDKFTQKIVNAGQPVYNNSQYNNTYAPELPNYEDWVEDAREDYDNLNEGQLREKFNAIEMKQYQKALAEYQKRTSAGKFNRAFMLTGSDRGKYVFIELRGKAPAGAGSSKATKEKEVSGKLTAADINEEINRINDREKRNKEIDTNRIHGATLEQIGKKRSAVLSLKHQGAVDRSILLYILLHETNGVYNLKQRSGIKGLPPEPAYGKVGYSHDYFKALGKVTDDQLATIIRTIAIDKYGNPKTFGDVRKEDTIMRLIAEYTGIDLKTVEANQAEVAKKRTERIKARIDSLHRQKSELKNPAKKPAANKKAAKK